LNWFSIRFKNFLKNSVWLFILIQNKTEPKMFNPTCDGGRMMVWHGQPFFLLIPFFLSHFLKNQASPVKIKGLLSFCFVSNLILGLLITIYFALSPFLFDFFSSISPHSVWFYLIFISNLVFILLNVIWCVWIIFYFHPSTFDFIYFHVKFGHHFFNWYLFYFGSFLLIFFLISSLNTLFVMNYTSWVFKFTFYVIILTSWHGVIGLEC
jgi:hypothetical protein